MARLRAHTEKRRRVVGVIPPAVVGQKTGVAVLGYPALLMVDNGERARAEQLEPLVPNAERVVARERQIRPPPRFAAAQADRHRRAPVVLTGRRVRRVAHIVVGRKVRRPPVGDNLLRQVGQSPTESPELLIGLPEKAVASLRAVVCVGAVGGNPRA